MSEKGAGQGMKKALKTATALALKKAKFATLKIQLIVLGIVLAIVLLVVIVLGIVSIIAGESEDTKPQGADLPPGQKQVSQDVLQYKDKILEELEKYEMEEHVDIVLALMMQESGGKGQDPMQSSESYCGSVGCITDTDLSIEKGVKHFRNVMRKANNDVKLALQSYNFGSGFIEYVNERGGEYTFVLAVEFSQMWYQKVKHTGNYSCVRAEAVQYMACYGDIMYVESVLAYLPSVSGGGDTEVIAGTYKSPLQRNLVITSIFSWRDIGDGDEHHNGLDLDCNSPDTIHAVKDGEVVHSGVAGGYGNLVTLKHGEGDYTSYAHLSSRSVNTGDMVEGGNQLGVCGTTGRSFGEHLHFEIKTEMWGGFKNPASYLGL